MDPVTRAGLAAVAAAGGVFLYGLCGGGPPGPPAAVAGGMFVAACGLVVAGEVRRERREAEAVSAVLWALALGPDADAWAVVLPAGSHDDPAGFPSWPLLRTFRSPAADRSLRVAAGWRLGRFEMLVLHAPWRATDDPAAVYLPLLLVWDGGRPWVVGTVCAFGEYAGRWDRAGVPEWAPLAVRWAMFHQAVRRDGGG